MFWILPIVLVFILRRFENFASFCVEEKKDVNLLERTCSVQDKGTEWTMFKTLNMLNSVPRQQAIVPHTVLSEPGSQTHVHYILEVYVSIPFLTTLTSRKYCVFGFTKLLVRFFHFQTCTYHGEKGHIQNQFRAEKSCVNSSLSKSFSFL